MADNLRNIVQQRDKDNARKHRLSGETVIPPGVAGASHHRRVCSKCWFVLVIDDDWMPIAHKCPKCGGTLHVITS